MHILSHGELDTRPFTEEERFARRSATLRAKLPSELRTPWSGQSEPWNVVKSSSISGPLTGNVRLMAVSMAHARPQDLMVVDSSDSRLHVLPANTSGESASDAGELTVETGDAPAAVLPVRVNTDARPGLVMVGRSVSHPRTMAPRPDPTYTVNRFDDPVASTSPITVATYCLGVANDCSFRQAVIKANTIPGSDTIMLPAGTYTLQQIGLAENDAVIGDVDVRDTLSIVGSVNGSGNPTSIIQGCGGTSGVACSGGTDWNDKFISTNKIGDTSASLSISNVVFQNANNTNTQAAGGFDYLGGAVDFFGCAAEGGGCSNDGGVTLLPVSSLSVTNNRFYFNTAAGCEAGNDCGGGLDSEFGPTTVSNTSFNANTASLGRGGALTLVGAKETMSLSNTTFFNNSSAQEGGALYIDFQNTSGAGNISIHNNEFESNTAGADGGGIYVNLGSGGNTTTATIDQGTFIFSNTSSQRGGGVAFSGITGTTLTPGTTSLSLSKVTITGNHANGSSDDGGGAILLTSGGTFTLQFSRIVGNTTTASGKPTGMTVEAGTGGSASTINAADNWWGCNTGPSASPCDTVATVNGSSPTATVAPWIVLTHTANPTGVLLNGTSALTADFLHEFDGTNRSSIALGNIDVLLGLPITFDTAVKGNISGADSTIQSNGTAAATFTGTACGAGSATAEVDNVDLANTNPNTTVIANITIQCPDLVAVKKNSITGATNGTVTLSGGSASWDWSVTVANLATTGTAAATFADGQTILTDTLPGTNITYGTPTFGGLNLFCSVTSNVLTCKANGGPVTIGLPGSFVVSIHATATAVGTYTNPTSGTCTVDPNNNVAENNEANNDCNSNSVTVTAPDLTATKGDSVGGSVPLSTGTWSWNVAVANSGNASATFADGQTILSDHLPSTNITYGSPTPGTFSGITNGANISCAITSNVLTCAASGAAVTIAGPGSFNVVFTATATVAGTYANPTGGTCSVDPNNNVSESNEANNACSDGVTVVAPPTISKAFSPTSIPLNGTSTLSFTLGNPNTSTALSGVAFGDTLPSGLAVATPNGAINNCSGTLTATAGSGSISLSGGTIASNSSCTISVDVKGTTVGSKSNTTDAITSTNGGTGTTSNTAVLNVASPPTISKAFGAASIPLNGTTSVTFNIINPNSGLALTGVAFSDTLPSGLVVATPNGESNTCNGTLSDTAGSGTISLSGGTLASSGSCAISVNVTGMTAGVKNNTTGTISSTETGAGATSNTASLTVAAPPTISKAFNPTSVAVNASSTLSFTITNPNTASALSGVSFTDNLPVGVVVAAIPNVTGSCGSGTITATAGSGTISLSGGTLTASPAAGSSCTFSADVTATTAGTKSNTTGAVTSTEGGTGSVSNTAILSVLAPPSIAKAFNPSTIALNATASLTFTITNPPTNGSTLTGVAFTDTLPTGLTVASGSATVCGGTLTTTAPTGIALSGASINSNSQCQFSVTVTGAASGQYTNTTGNVTSTNGGTGNTATANLTVATPPTISKAFGAATIPVSGTTSLSFNITNPNSSLGLTGVAFTDNLPAGLVVATPNNLNSTCGGTATAVAGSSSVSLSGAALSSNALCAISVNVTGTTAGVKINSVTVTATETGQGNTSNASLAVVAPPVIRKAFAASSIPLNTSVNVTFTITNPNTSTSLTGLAFSDTLPSGLPVSSTPNVSNTCSGTVTAAANSGTISLSGGSVAAGISCVVTVSVTGTAAGTKNNTTGNISSSEGGTGSTSNTATVTVVAPPTISKAFAVSTIQVNTSTNLSFTVGNPAGNSATLTGVAFTDNLPSGLAVSNPSVVTGSCGGGTITATASSSSISLSGATLVVGTSCSFSVSVTGTANGTQVNQTDPVTSTNGGTGNSATASVTVISRPVITTQPTSQRVCEDTNVTFTAAASGVPAPSVQWQSSVDGGAHWHNILGATSTTLTFVAHSLDDGTKFRAVFTNIYGSATTNAATLRVNTKPKITTQPSNHEVRAGQQVTFTAAASGQPPPTVHWQVSTNGGKTWANISGATSTTLTFNATAAQDENRYRAVFTNTCGKATTQAAILDVD